MKIFLGSTNAIQRDQATRWLRNERTLRDLEAFGLRSEPELGECFIFLEVGFPQFDPKSRNKQIDLIVSFDERIAIVEIKRGDFERLNAREVVEQMDGQEKTFKGLLRKGGLALPFSSILFCPKLSAEQLLSLREKVAGVQDSQHIQIAGSREELRSRTETQRPLHIISVLESSLYFHELKPSASERKAQLFITSVLTEGDRRLEQYKNADDTLSALRRFARSPYLCFPVDYVEGTRDSERDVALAKLRAGHVVELCGPPGIGKSLLAMELILELGLTFYEPRLRTKLQGTSTTFEDIERILEETIEGVADPALPNARVVARLASEDAVFWIKSYHEDYRLSLSHFLSRLETSGLPKKAFWIVESRRPLDGHKAVQVDLGGLDSTTLARLLLRRSLGESALSVEEAIGRARGNPGAAIRALMANDNLGSAASEFGWFEHQLKATERRVLSFICFAMRTAPLGLSRTLLDEFISMACPDLPSFQCKAATERALSALRDEQLADMSPFSAIHFGGLLDAIVPAGTEFMLVHSVDAHLIATVTRHFDKNLVERLSRAFEGVLVEAVSLGNLAEVTYEMCVSRNLEPFIRSSFRFTSLGPVLKWIESTSWEPPDTCQAYLLKVLRILDALHRESSVDVQRELDTLDDRDPVQAFARDYAVARSMTVRDLPGDFDCTEWRTAVDRIPDPDLRVAFYMSCSTSLQQAGRERDAWRLLLSVLPGYSDTTSGGALLQHEVANFVNRKKGRVVAGQGSESAAFWTDSASRSLVASGLLFQNIHLICEGLFYYARASEFSDGRTEFGKVLRYRSALDWIENVPGALSRWRMRILLTRGSIHRHYLRTDQLPWREFAIHLELAWADYKRAFLSSFRHRHSLHVLNSLAYSIGLCRAALKYRDDPDARTEIQPFMREALERCELVRRDILRQGPDEIRIWGNIGRGEVILLYVVSVSLMNAGRDAPLKSLDERWAGYVDLVLGARSEGNFTAVDDAFKDLVRGLQFAEKVDAVHHAMLCRRIRTHLERLLRETFPGTGHRRPPELWGKLRELTSRCQRA